MGERGDKLLIAAILRQRAEELANSKSEADKPDADSTGITICEFTEASSQKFIREFKIKQIELELMLEIVTEELSHEKIEKAKRAMELAIANKELLFQDEEKSNRAAELVIANNELLFQNEEKEKRAAELIIVNQELDLSNKDKTVLEEQYLLVNRELLSQSREIEVRLSEMLNSNKELLFQNEEKSKRTAELILANKELFLQNEKRAKQTAELLIFINEITLQRDRLQKIGTHVPGLIYQYCLRPDGSSFFPYASEAINQIYRVTPEEVRDDASKVFLNIHPDDYESLLISIRESAKNLSLWQHEFRMKFQDGTHRSLYGNAMPQAEADGSVLWHGFITDITERKLAEQKNVSISLRYQAILKSASDGIHILDTEGNLVEANSAFCEMLGYTHEEILGLNVADWDSHFDREELFIKLMELIEVPALFQTQHRRKDGTIINIEINASCLVLEGFKYLIASARDITESNLTQQKLKDSESRYSSMISNISDVISIMSANSIMKYVSSNVEKQFGWLPEDLVGLNAFSIIHTDDLPHARKELQLFLESDEKTMTTEFRLRCKDRSCKFIEIISCNLLNDPIINGVLVNFRDITNRKQIENTLSESEEKYRNLYESLKDSVITTDLEGHILDCNQATLDMLGYAMEEMKNLTYKQFTPVKWHAFEDQIIKPQITDRGYSDEYEKEYIRKDGLVIPISLRSWLIKDHDGNPSRFWAIIRDITTRKSIEEKLQSKSSLLEAQLNTTVEGILMVDKQNIRLLINQRFIDLLNVPSHVLEVKDDSMLLNYVVGLTKNPVLFLDKVNYLNSHSDEKSYDEVEFKSGIVLERYSAPILGKEGKNDGRIWTFRDITSHKLTEQQIKVKNEELHKLNSERDKFFSIIAHDLRGPLGGFMGLTEMMADKDQDFTEIEKKEMILELSRSSRNTFNLLENLLEWSQMDHGISEFKPQKLELMKVVTDCINIVAEPARGKEIALIVDIPDSLEVFADKNMLQTVIRNLLSNAIKFTHTGGHVTISAKPAENSMVVISVKDTGIGMSNKMRNDIFRIDANTKRPGTNGEKSTGLGLLLCKEFVGKQGGEIWVESETFKGSVFRFTIPSIGQKENEIGDPETEFKEKPENQITGLKILIAEDDEISSTLIHAIVKGFSRDILMANTGDYAVEICRTNADIDLILMDIAMPGMDGYEATRHIRKFNQKVVIIAQTTFALAADRKKAIESGCNDYIAKPFGKYALIEVIKKHIK